MDLAKLPYLTDDLPGIGGATRQRAEDFHVREEPLVRPAGRGPHAFFLVTKTGITTQTAVERLARHMLVPRHAIGFAGLKDAQSVASQWMSLENADPKRLRAFRNRNLRIEELTWHSQRLRIGQLRANHFSVRIRGVGRGELSAAQAVLEALSRRGAPNYFGPQRFGLRGDNDALGEALLRGRLDDFLRLYLGSPLEGDEKEFRAAREAFQRGDLRGALRRWPRQCTDPRRALVSYMKRRRAIDAVAAIDVRLKRLLLSAFQSRIFNQVLAERIQTIDGLLEGDVVEDRATGELFPAEPTRDQGRLERFQISPTGILPGYDSRLSDGPAGRIERQVLSRGGIELEMFACHRAIAVKGARRALRFRLQEPAIAAGRDRHGTFIELRFAAPSGCYATVVLDEIRKTRTPT